MMRRSRTILIAVLFVALALMPSMAVAQAHTMITCEPCSRPYQRWVNEAKVPTPNVSLTVEDAAGRCLAAEIAFPACTDPAAGVIFFSPGTMFHPHEIFLHELGHNFDHYSLPAWGRARFEALTADARPWDTASTESGNGPIEHFADAYARCALTGTDFRGDPDLYIKGSEGSGITQTTFRRICRMIVAVGRPSAESSNARWP